MNLATARAERWGRLPVLLLGILLFAMIILSFHLEGKKADERAARAAETAALDSVGDVLNALQVLSRDGNLLRGQSAKDLSSEVTATLARLDQADVRAADRIGASLSDPSLKSLTETAQSRLQAATYPIRDDLAAIGRLDDGLCSDALSVACISFLSESVAKLERAAGSNPGLSGRRSMQALQRDWPVVAEWMQARLQQQGDLASPPSAELLSELVDGTRRSLVEDLRGHVADLTEAWGAVMRAAIDLRRSADQDTRTQSGG